MKLSAVWSKGMVVQREEAIPVWGKTAAGAVVTGTFAGQSVTATADEAGAFSLCFSPLAAGGPYTLVLRDGSEERVIDDILVGDVYLLGGQSNMELPITRTLDLYEAEVRAANDSQLRMFEVPKEYLFSELRDEVESGHWITATGAEIDAFSAAGYFFAKELRARYQVPIGLLQTAVGGTPVEAWMSEETLRSFGGYEKELDQNKDAAYVAQTIATDNQNMQTWYEALREQEEKQAGDVTWERITLPRRFRGTELATFIGSLWLRRKFTLTEETVRALAADSAETVLLRLGLLVDSDDAYINGQWVGATGYQYPPRKYGVPKKALRAGENELTVRLVVNGGNGGFMPDKPYRLELPQETIDLTGEWDYRIAATAKPFPGQTFFQYKPTGLYNGMIHPLRRFPVRGVCYYQGESNSGRPQGYYERFAAMIADWRRLFARPELPVFFVQLANFSDGVWREESAELPLPEDGWAALREEQRKSLAVPHTAMVAAYDIGAYNDLHPQNKKELGRRLALCARRDIYGEALSCSGPMVAECTVEGETALVRFDASNGLRTTDGQPPRLFALAAAEGSFYPATAELQGDRVRLSSVKVKQPARVRFAWADNPQEPNLTDGNGLPAIPFEESCH